METIFGTINSIERNECKPKEYYYRACDIETFKDNCINCDLSHTRKLYELERTIKFLKNYRCEHQWKCIHQLEERIFDEPWDKYPTEINLIKTWECQKCGETKETVIRKI